MKNNLLGVLMVLGLWQLAASVEVFSSVYFASPLETVREGVMMLSRGEIYDDILSTLGRILVSLGISIVIGIPLGIAIGYNARLYQLLNHSLDFFRSVPPIVFYPLLLISLGPGESSRIATAILASSVMIVLIVSTGLIQQERLRTDYFRALGTKKVQLFKDIVWHEALPGIMTALRAAASWTVIIIIVTEMLVGPKSGLGARVQSVQIFSNIPDLFFTIIIIGMIGVGLNHLFEWLNRKVVFWKAQ
jgi:NitT/TauT family transport system permease protein